MPHPPLQKRPFARRWFPLGGLLLLTLAAPFTAAGCGGGKGRKAALATAAADEEWLWLQRTQQELEAKRAQLPAAEPGGPAGPPTAEAARLRREVEILTAALDRRLVEFINAHPPVQGEPLTHRQETALRMKSDEDLVTAHEHIEKGGDYQRAIEICESALAIDPDNPRLRDELAKIRAARFMTADRFAQAKKGMTPPEVREALGAPNPKNVRAYPERGIEAWFYPKDESGAAAAVWFQKRPREEDTKSYELDFDAIHSAPPGKP